jgi:hypothetical protein
VRLIPMADRRYISKAAAIIPFPATVSELRAPRTVSVRCPHHPGTDRTHGFGRHLTIHESYTQLFFYRKPIKSRSSLLPVELIDQHPPPHLDRRRPYGPDSQRETNPRILDAYGSRISPPTDSGGRIKPGFPRLRPAATQENPPPKKAHGSNRGESGWLLPRARAGVRRARLFGSGTASERGLERRERNGRRRIFESGWLYMDAVEKVYIGGGGVPPRWALGRLLCREYRNRCRLVTTSARS